MVLRRAAQRATGAVRTFSVRAYLDSSGIGKTVRDYRRGETIFTQGDACEDVFYIQTGGVKLSVLSRTGQEVVSAMLVPGDFFGEGCLAGQPVRVGTARAITPSLIRLVCKSKMAQLLQAEHAMADRFIAHMLSRTIRIEADLVEQLFKMNPERGVQ